MAVQKSYLNGSAIPRRTGARNQDDAALYAYLYRAMDQLGHAIEELERRLEACERENKTLRTETAGQSRSRSARRNSGE